MRLLPAEPDELLEAATEALVGPRLGIDFEPRTLADLMEIIRPGRTVRFGGVGDDGQRLIPEGVDLMEILREVAAEQYRRQLDVRMRKLVEARLENVEGAEMLSTKWKREGPLEQLAEIADVSLAALEREALDELNAADHLAFRLQRGSEDYFPLRSPEGVESTATLTQVAEARGWTAPVNRFGWSERQQMDYIAHRLGIMDENTSFYVQDLPLREDMYVRGIGQDVHMRIFERQLAESGIIFSAELFYDLEAAYKVFNQRMGGWAKFIESVGPLPKDMTIDEFIRRITGEGPRRGRGLRGPGVMRGLTSWVSRSPWTSSSVHCHRGRSGSRWRRSIGMRRSRASSTGFRGSLRSWPTWRLTLLWCGSRWRRLLRRLRGRWMTCIGLRRRLVRHRQP